MPGEAFHVVSEERHDRRRILHPKIIEHQRHEMHVKDLKTRKNVKRPKRLLRNVLLPKQGRRLLRMCNTLWHIVDGIASARASIASAGLFGYSNTLR